MFGEDSVTTGASNDIERATLIARNMVTKWGFSKRLAPMQYEKDSEQSMYLGGSGTTTVAMSDKTALLIDEEVTEIINSCYKKAKELLEANKDILENMKDALLKYETIDADQIDDLMNRREVRAPSLKVEKSNDDSSSNGDNKDNSEKSSENSEKTKLEQENNDSSLTDSTSKKDDLN